MKKQGLSLEAHKKIGARLGSIRDELTELSVEIGNAYSHKLVTDLIIAIANIDKLRSNLDDKVINENPSIGNDILLNIYYGNRSQEGGDK